MKVGISFDLRNPEPWAPPWDALYGTTLELCEHAEALGADSGSLPRSGARGASVQD
ncbi:MAG: hypothetical protein ABWY80_06005 [Acidimicrobiia bacterium]